MLHGRQAGTAVWRRLAWGAPPARAAPAASTMTAGRARAFATDRPTGEALPDEFKREWAGGAPNLDLPRFPLSYMESRPEASLEDIFYLLRIPQRKPYGTMEDNVKKAMKSAKDDRDGIIGVLPDDKKETGLEMYNEVTSGKYGLERLLDAIVDKDADKLSIRLTNALEKLADLELLQAPELAFLLPPQYQEYPRLTGRATVQFVLEKGETPSIAFISIDTLDEGQI